MNVFTLAVMVQYEDILPTLIELAGGKPPPDMDGKSLLDVFARKTDEHREYAYGVHSNPPEGHPYPIRSIRTPKYKLIHNLMWESAYYEKHQTISYNIKVLQQAGLIEVQKEGRKRKCFIAQTDTAIMTV